MQTLHLIAACMLPPVFLRKLIPAKYFAVRGLSPAHTGWHALSRYSCSHSTKGNPMLSYAITFLIVALIAGLFGFMGVAGLATEIAKILFFVFIVLFIVSLVTGRRPPV
jgi:uncharacterized membrane protein YtjA (UPF0391 family)